MRPRIFVSRQLPESGISLLRNQFEVDVWPDNMPPSRSELLKRVVGCAGILSLLSDAIDGEVMDAAGPSLKGVANFAVGYNNIDVAAATQRGIQIGNTPDVLTDATADIAVGLALASGRHFREAIRNVDQLEWKTWEPMYLLGQDFSKQTLGIVGMGRIGAAVARRLHGGWSMRVIYTSRSPKPEIDRELNATRVELDELLQQSDVVSVHTDLNPATKQLFTDREFGLMKPNATFVNTARGGVVNQTALFDALRSQTIFAAGLDVTDPEPLPDDNPLRTLPNCIILPHIGSATFTARNRMSVMAAENLIAAISGKRMQYSVTA